MTSKLLFEIKFTTHQNSMEQFNAGNVIVKINICIFFVDSKEIYDYFWISVINAKETVLIKNLLVSKWRAEKVIILIC